MLIIDEGATARRYSLTELRADNPDTSFPRAPSAALLAEYGVYEIEETTPTHNPQTHTAEEVFVKVGETWTHAWTYAPVDGTTQAANVEGLLNSCGMRELNIFARTRGYADITAACTYVLSSNPTYAAEGARAVALRDAFWAACEQVQQDVADGLREAPTCLDDIADVLPPLTWE